MLAIRALVLNPADVTVYWEVTRFNHLNAIGNPLCNKALCIEFEADVAVGYRDSVALVDRECLTALRSSGQRCTLLNDKLLCCHRITGLTPYFGIVLEKLHINCIFLSVFLFCFKIQRNRCCNTWSYRWHFSNILLYNTAVAKECIT